MWHHSKSAAAIYLFLFPRVFLLFFFLFFWRRTCFSSLPLVLRLVLELLYEFPVYVFLYVLVLFSSLVPRTDAEVVRHSEALDRWVDRMGVMQGRGIDGWTDGHGGFVLAMALGPGALGKMGHMAGGRVCDEYNEPYSLERSGWGVYQIFF